MQYRDLTPTSSIDHGNDDFLNLTPPCCSRKEEQSTVGQGEHAPGTASRGFGTSLTVPRSVPEVDSSKIRNISKWLTAYFEVQLDN